MGSSPVFEHITSTDENGWTPIQHVSHSPVFENIRSTDLNWWTPIQTVSHSPVFEQIKSTYQNGWTSIQLVSHSPVFENIRSIDLNQWTPSRLWVTLQYLSWSDPLIRMAEHPSRMWVALQCSGDQIHWPEWLNTYLGCELLTSVQQIRSADQNGWTPI